MSTERAVVTVYCRNPDHRHPIDGHSIMESSSGGRSYSRSTFGNVVQPPHPDIKADAGPDEPMPDVVVIRCYRSPKCRLNVEISRETLHSFLHWIAASPDVTYWRMTAPELQELSTHRERWAEALKLSLALGRACRDATSERYADSI